MDNLFLELLQISLGNRVSLSKIPSRKEWLYLLDIAQQQAIVGVLVNGIDKLPKEQIPEQEVLLQWIGVSQMIAVTYHNYYQRSRELTALFEEVGFRSCVLKGIVLAQLYPDPSSRQCGDIDLWIEGDRRKIMSWLRSKYQLNHVVWHNVSVQIFNDVPVEVHFHPGWLYNPFHNFKLQQWFEREKANILRNVNKTLGVSVPSVEFNAVYSLVHSYRHLIAEGVGLRYVVDYYFILRVLSTDKRTEVLFLLRQFGLIKFARGLMWILQNVCRMPTDYLLCEPDEREGRFLVRVILQGGNFGHYRKDNLKYNNLVRWLVMFKHYPNEVLWIIPWKIWHRCWRFLNT